MNAVLVFSLLAASAMAATPVRRDPHTLVERDFAAISSIIADVQAKTTALDSAVQAFGPDNTDIVPLITAADDLKATLDSGTATVTASDPLTTADALNLAGLIGDLTTVVQNTVKDFIAKKPFVDTIEGLADAFVAELTPQKASSDALAAAITSKVPADLQELAASLSAPISAALQSAIDAFSGTPTTTTTTTATTEPPATTSDTTTTEPPVTTTTTDTSVYPTSSSTEVPYSSYPVSSPSTQAPCTSSSSEAPYYPSSSSEAPYYPSSTGYPSGTGGGGGYGSYPAGSSTPYGGSYPPYPTTKAPYPTSGSGPSYGFSSSYLYPTTTAAPYTGGAPAQTAGLGLAGVVALAALVL